ncbi:G-type lectin S-receptor-like serine/threonine-protein kinase [Citrus sinensis]|uniref:G-type lectin S-receptor-like serine/threonine-protein kinase n=1 Tax=Citrus sinensis TaxID=2711 RepID=A0ACB8J9U3_CITSI|nr:G-type lectin S-receptor-like serine/threonine-protein kinase [Citrus sinensis]
MERKERNRHLLIMYSCLVLLTLQTSFSETDKLLQNQQLSDLDEPLVSASGKFMLGFFSPRFSTDKYLGIWYNRPAKESGYYKPPVWVANRNTPIFHKESASLTIDSKDGNLKILREGENPIAISSIQEGGNVTRATLLQSGNFVLQEMNSDGMKIGINLQTGHKWFLQSWIGGDSPAPGSFTIRLDSNTGNQLIIQSTEGKVLKCELWNWFPEINTILDVEQKDYWKSGILSNGHFNFSDLESINQDYNFSFISDEKEQYFSYSVNEDVISLFPMLKIDPEGGLTGHRFTIGPCGLYQECGQAQNCSCFACAPTNSVANTGCEFWSKGAKFAKISDPNFVRPIYIFEPKAENKQWRVFVIVGALLVLLMCILCCLTWRKYKEKAEGRMDQQNQVNELGDSLSTFNGKRRTKDMKHELKGFNFQTIAAATNNFSTTNKLGEGGFGPVYKGSSSLQGKLLDGQVIAVKRLSGRTSQGIVEFRNEAKVIGNSSTQIYGYMAPEYAMNGIVSMKADVFSFGVLLLEIVSGRKNNNCYDEERPLNLVGYLWKEGKASELMEAALDGPCPENELLRCIHAGLLCVHDQAVNRPTMADVVSCLRQNNQHFSSVLLLRSSKGSRRGDPVNDSWQDVRSYPRIKARSPSPFAYNDDIGASTSEGGQNNGRGLRKTGIQRKPIKR